MLGFPCLQSSCPDVSSFCADSPAPEAESSFGAPSTDAAELSTGRDVAMASSAPADAELLDDADTETAAAAADRCEQG